MNLQRRLLSSIFIIASFFTFVQSNALGDVSRQLDVFDDDKYDDENDTVDLKEALGKINASTVQLQDEGEIYVLNMSTFYQFLKDDFLTDCTFLVGPTGQVEEVRAHCVVLAAASPLLRELFKSNNSTQVYRMPETTAKELQHILKFVYSGETCSIEDFEQAQALYTHAALLGLHALKNVAKSFIFSRIEPKTAWKVLRLATDAKDETLEKAAWHVIERQTQSIIKDSSFNQLSRDDVLKFVSRNGLKVDEYELYEAIVKWATVRAANAKMEITPSNLRTTIGSQILKKVRFLTMTSAEFSRVYMGFKILSYDEILPIIFNINDKNSVPLPETISTSTEIRRNAVADTFFTYKAVSPCSLPNTEILNRDFVHFSPKGIIKSNNEKIVVTKIQIPMSIASIESCCKINEKFDILVFDEVGRNIRRKSFNDFATCIISDENSSCNRTESGVVNLIDVGLDDYAIELHEGYSLQVEFHNNMREYPKLPPLYKSNGECKPHYESRYNYGSYEDIRDENTESKCSVNEFIYLTYF